MEKEFNTEIVQQILGPSEYSHRRTPLHVRFSSDTTMNQAEIISGKAMNNAKKFNAIGSKLAGVKGEALHLPVLDIDNIVEIQTVERRKTVHKLIMFTAYRGSYEPDSQLTELLDDHDITHEMYYAPRGKMKAHPHNRNRRDAVSSMYEDRFDTDREALQVKAVVLRSEKQIFQTFPSTNRNHNHVYIDTLFNETDHRLLIEEFTMLGLISRAWRKITLQEGMGVVRTPWTEKKIDHYGS